MQAETTNFILPKKFGVGSLLAVTFGLLMCVAVNGCATREKPSAASAPSDVNDLQPYLRIDSGDVLAYVNDGLRVWKFTRDSLEDKRGVWLTLDVVCDLVDGQIYPERRAPNQPSQKMTSVGVAPWPDSSSGWLRGKEKSEAVFAELTRDPEFVFKGDAWTVVVNIFNRDGSLDRWEFAGNVEPETNLLQARRIDIARLKPPGTFSWAYLP